jgi:hypothetical protein
MLQIRVTLVRISKGTKLYTFHSHLVNFTIHEKEGSVFVVAQIQVLSKVSHSHSSHTQEDCKVRDLLTNLTFTRFSRNRSSRSRSSSTIWM